MGHSLDGNTLRAALGYLFIVTVLFHRLLLGEALSPAANVWMDVPFRSVARSDLTRYLNGIQGDAWRACEPWHIYQYRSAREGRFPLWNPHIFGGFPFHGNAQAAMLSPFHWIYFFVDPTWSSGVVAAVKLWLAGMATFCFGRRLGLVPLGAFLAGTAWMLSAFNVRWLLWPLANVTAVLPVLLWSLDALVTDPSWRRLALAGFATTVLQLSGHPECQFLAAALSGLFLLLRVVFMRAGGWESVRLVLLGLAAHLLGLLGAAAALLPFAEQMVHSVDWHESTHALRRYLPAEGLIGSVAPDHFGRPRAGRIYYDRLHVNYIEAGLYVGLIPLALALTAMVRVVAEPRRAVGDPLGQAAVIFAVWFVLCGAVALGMPGLTHLVHHLPLFSKVDILRLLFGVQFAAAMLAGIAWTWIDRRLGAWTFWPLPFISFAIALALLLILLWPELPGLYSHREGLRLLWTDPSTPAPLEHRSFRTLVSFAFGILAAVWSVWCLRSIRKTRSSAMGGLSAALIVFSCCDLMWVAYGFNPAVPARYVFPPPPDGLQRVAANLGHGRMIATDEILSPNLAIVYGLRDLRGYDFPIDPHWAMLFRRLGWIGDQVGITLLPRRDIVPCIPPRLQSVLDKSAVRFLYTNIRPDSLGVCDEQGKMGKSDHWPLVQAGPGDDAVYQNPTAYDRAYFARRARAVDDATSLDALLEIEHDFREQSYVVGPIDLTEADSGAQGSVEIEVDESETVVLRTRNEAAGLLVLSDRYDRGWRVTIDGERAAALRANYLFRGVVVPPGEHRVQWIYRPWSVPIGFGISSVALMALAAGSCFRVRIFRRACPGPLR